MGTARRALSSITSALPRRRPPRPPLPRSRRRGSLLEDRGVLRSWRRQYRLAGSFAPALLALRAPFAPDTRSSFVMSWGGVPTSYFQLLFRLRQWLCGSIVDL